MAIEDQVDFPRFSTVSTALRDTEDRMLNAIKSRDKGKIVEAKLVLMAALDEYRKAVGGIGEAENRRSLIARPQFLASAI